ncbi:MAG TPA: dihydroorotase, partial [Terricaulis sp.]|nr:dihydroorotase [Terricaulis sp.]
RQASGPVFEAKGLTILPGVIDTQVHFREPGNPQKEDLESGTRAAALGGVTGVFEMPNTAPPTTNPEAIADKLARAKGRAHVDHAFYVGATHENAHLLGELERLPGVCGVKTFMGSSTGTLLVGDDDGLDNILKNIKRRGAFHAEDEDRLNQRKKLAREGDWTSHPEVRDDEAALKAVQRLVESARKHRKRVHVLHVSSAKEMEFLATAKDVATVETLPQFLTFEGPEIYQRLKGFAQMNPPIRYAADRAALWSLGIAQSVVDIIATDHAPHTKEEKAQPYPKSPSGMPGVQTLVPVMLTHVNEGRLSLARFVDLSSAGPQRVFGIEGKGRIALGYDADFTIVDMAARRVIRAEDQATRCGWTPFDGFEAKGWPMATIIRGQIVMR